MKLCFPITQNQGLASRVFSHFGVTPKFLVIDTDTNDIQEVSVQNSGQEGGLSNVLATLKDIKSDGIALAGIGQGALNILRKQGFTVYRAEETIDATLNTYHDNGLEQWPDKTVCNGLDEATLEELSRVSGVQITIDKTC